MTAPRLAFVDWLKCIGMTLIVLGHTGAQSYFDPSPPINFKQFGVAFFVFVMGFSLARETRGTGKFLVNRLFDVFLFGGCFAVLMSAIAWVVCGDLSESNYLPFVLGVNVAFNSFPANPTTWYIGTYIHLLLSWALIWRRVQIGPWMIIACLLLEIPIRVRLMSTAGDYVAYMLLTNWTCLLLLGLYFGGESVRMPITETKTRLSPLLEVGTLIAILFVWPQIIGQVGVARGFPFARVAPASNELLSLLGTSAAVSVLYVTYTVLAFRITRYLPAVKVITFLANNTLLIFIAHMPMVYLLSPVLNPFISSPSLRILINLVLFLVLPAICSEVLRRLVQPATLRVYIEDCFSSWISMFSKAKRESL